MKKWILVEPYDGKTEVILDLIRDNVDIVLRIKHPIIKPKKIKIKPLKITDISLIQSKNFKKINDRIALNNAKKCFRLSRKLYCHGEFRDSYLYLHLSFEHLLKYLIVKTAYAYDYKYLDTLPVGDDEVGKSNDRSHDLKSILIFLNKVISDFKNKVQLSSLLSELSKANSNGNWAQVRYAVDPTDPLQIVLYRTHYDNLKPHFAKFYFETKKLGLLK